VLVAAAPFWPQLRALLVALCAATVCAATSAALPGVAQLEGSLGERETDGAVLLCALVAAMLLAALVTAWVAVRERDGRLPVRRFGGARHVPTIAVATVVVALGVLIAIGLSERGDASDLGRRADASRLVSIESRRYDYWRIAVDEIGRDPIAGTGAGGFRVLWLQERPVAEGALEVHSLLLEAMVELGVVGLLGLALLVGGSGAAARRALRVRPVLAAGPTAACSAWLLHAMIDWDWQLPAATLPTLILVGALIAASEVPPSGPAPEPPKTQDVPVRELAAHAYPGPVSASRRD
jgi:O-antigen ligase